MASIQVKQNGPQMSLATPVAPVWDPSRWISRMMGFDPFREMMPLVSEQRLMFEPDFEVKETKDSYMFKADLPGVKMSDIDVSVTENRIQVSGKREMEKEEKGDTFYMCERSYGAFTRAFTLPDGVEASKIQADLRDGVLTIVAQKKPESVPKKIPIGTAPEAKKG